MPTPDDDGWISPPTELVEATERACLVAAIETLAGIDFDSEGNGPVRAILGAMAAAEETARQASRTFAGERDKVHSVYVDALHIAATACVAHGDREFFDAEDFHPYSMRSQPMLAFARAFAVLEAVNAAVALADDDEPCGHGAAFALSTMSAMQC